METSFVVEKMENHLYDVVFQNRLMMEKKAD